MRVRDAQVDDLPAIVAMYADDDLGQARENPALPLAPEYLAAFHEIGRDPRHRLVVAEADDDIVATLQLSFIPHLVLGGGERAQIEGVRVRAGHRGGGIGQALMTWAIEQARDRGCLLVQLATNVARPEARRFYEQLGFVGSHVGMKLSLGSVERSG